MTFGSVTSRLGTLWTRAGPAIQRGLGAYAAVRILLLALAAAVVLIYPGTLDPEAAFRQRVGIPAAETAVENTVWGVWLRFDTLWYLRYARDGLLTVDHDEYRAFWPLYPWLIRWTAPLIGGDRVAAALIISNVALAIAVVLFYRLTDMECGPEVAQRGVWYMLVFPSALFLFAAYSEPLFLAFSLAAFWAARRGRWRWAGLWAGLCAMSRVSGAFVLPALGFEYARQRLSPRGWHSLRDARWWWTTVLSGWPLLIAAAGVGFLPVYTALVLQGDSVSSALESHIQNPVSGFAFPWVVLAQAFRSLAEGDFFVIQPFDLAALLLYLGLTAGVFSRLPAVYGVYSAVTMLVLLSRHIPQHPLIGTSRYVCALFPGFMLLGMAGQKPWVNRLILYPSVLLLAFFATQFMIGGFVG